MADPNNTNVDANIDCSAPPILTFAAPGPTGPYKPQDLCVGTLSYTSGECADNEAKLQASYMAETLNMAGGSVNVFPMLGVHSQGSTADTTLSTGYSISSGTPAGFNATDAFSILGGSWRSIQQGVDVVTTPAYIGYCFGTKKAWDKIGVPQERYFTPEPVRKQISTIKIKQGLEKSNRATRVRVEASDDGITWDKIGNVALTDSADLVSVGVSSNAIYNCWRLIPTFFNGTTSNSQWEVQELHLIEASTTSIDNIQDFFLLENRDRCYQRNSVLIKATYDLLDVQTELAKFGISLPQTYVFTCSFDMLVKALGRPLVVGDVLELPGEIQYDTQLRPVRKWLEVSDTSWATEGYTINWKPGLYKFYAQPINPSQEHRDLLGSPGKINDQLSDDDVLAGMMQNDQAFKSAKAFKQKSADDTPQRGADGQNIQSGMGLEGPGSYDGRDVLVEDAIPPNGIPFTSGNVLPPSAGLTVGSYHRQTYTQILDPGKRPPDRLLKYLGDGKWTVIEVNTRDKYESWGKYMSKLMHSTNQVNLDSFRP